MKALIHDNVEIAPLTTFGIGGPARYLIEASTEETVIEAVRFANDLNIPFFVLGGGSNLLVADSGFPGLVLRIVIKGLDWQFRSDTTVVRCGAGEDWDDLVAQSVERGLSGVECLSGIPGSVGGTPVQNVGAYGQEVSEVLTHVHAYDRRTGSVVEIPREECSFDYRKSIFNTSAKDRYIVLSVTYAFTNGATPVIRYPEVQRELDGIARPPTPSDVRAAVRRIRSRKAMLLVEGDPDCRSAGSFFKNPIVSETQFAEIERCAGAGVPKYPASSGNVKIAAAWLIERAGFHKGYSIGPVGLSTKHTLALVNKGGARAEDVVHLARHIRERVRDKFGVTLVPEPVFLGFDHDVYAEFSV